MMRPILLVVALICYAAFFASFAYLVGFVGGFDFMPTHVDKGLAAPPSIAALINLALIALFGVQHSVMARQGFKRGWKRVVPEPIERSVYCLSAALALAAMFLFWHPIAGSLWTVENELARTIIWALFWLGWGVVFVSTWLLSHFELFGLQQAWNHMRGIEARPMTMKTPLFYKLVRHPIYSGFFIAFWATPDMTYSHLLLAVGFTVYIAVGIMHEERDLVAMYGEEYLVYRRRVGAILPGIGKRA